MKKALLVTVIAFIFQGNAFSNERQKITRFNNAGLLVQSDVNMSIERLEYWGDLNSINAEIIDGDNNTYGKYIINDTTSKIDAGYFGVNKNKFRMVFPFTELATVLKGSVTLMNELTGETKTFIKGDSWIIKKGTPILWETNTDGFVKFYLKID